MVTPKLPNTWHGDTRVDRTTRSTRSMEFELILLHLLHNTDTNMLCRLFDGRKYVYIYLTIHQEYCYLGKQIMSCYFPEPACEHLWLSPCNVIAIPRDISLTEDLTSSSCIRPLHTPLELLLNIKGPRDLLYRKFMHCGVAYESVCYMFEVMVQDVVTLSKKKQKHISTPNVLTSPPKYCDSQ